MNFEKPPTNTLKLKSENYAQMKKAEALQMIENWSASDITGLANHFHGITAIGEIEPFQIISRVEQLFLDPKDLEIEDESLMLCMALTSEKSSQFLTFSPMLHLRKQDKYIAFNKTKPDSLNNGKIDRIESVGASIVPKSFLQSVSKNWLLLDPAFVDDVFLARTDNGKNEAPRLERLNGYYISSKVNSLLYHAIKESINNGNLNYIAFHLGVDMNKANFRGEFTFSPVIELNTWNIDSIYSDLKNMHLGQPFGKKEHLPGVIMYNEDSGSLLFEYLHPCPSTCPPDPDDPSEV